MHTSLRRAWIGGALFVLLLTAIFAAANTHWLAANTVTYGWDRLDHLITSFVYRDTLGQVTPASLLAALSYSDYYPPLVHWGSVILYRLFGVSEDVAPLVNVFYLAILLGSTFWIAANWSSRKGGFPEGGLPGRGSSGKGGFPEGWLPGRVASRKGVFREGWLPGRVASRKGVFPEGGLPGSLPAHPLWTGALAATLVGLFPIIFAMSRYLYLDFALAALVALSMALLLASRRFGRRWPSLGFGLALGLAFLVKWTAAAFVIGPLLYLLLRSGALSYVWKHPRALLPAWGRLAACLLAGVGVFALWFALAPDVVAGLRLGWLLALPLGLLLGGVIYSLLPYRGAPADAAGIRPAVGESRRDHEAAPAGLMPLRDTPAHAAGGASAAVRNILGAGVIAAFIIALWYLTNIEFLDYFLFTAYGREDEPFYAFGKYAGELFREQLGPWFSLVFVVVVLVWAWQAVVRRPIRAGSVSDPFPPVPTGSVADAPGSDVRAGSVSDPFPPDAMQPVAHASGSDVRAGSVSAPFPPGAMQPVAHASGSDDGDRRVSDTAWVLVLWVLVPYLIFSFRVTLAHSRFVMPFLPPFAIWMAVGLMSWRPRLLRIAAIVTVLLVGVAQFALVSFDELASWRTPLRVEIGGQPLNLLAEGFFIQYPTSGVTDSGYAVAPEILAYVDSQRAPGGGLAGREVANLGLLVNSYQVHEKHFLYSIYKDFPQVRLRELARNWREQGAYNQLFEMDYVLLSDTHTFRTNENSQAAAQRILYDPGDAFNQAFAPVQEWTLPSGEHLTLYGRRFPSLEPGAAPADYQALLTLFGDRLGPGDAVVLVSPDQVYMLGLSLPAEAEATIAPLPMPGEGEADTLARLERLAAEHRRIFLVSHNAEQVDPTGSIEGWLRANLAAAGDQWAGGIRVTPLAVRPPGDPVPLATAEWSGGPQLIGAEAPPSTPAGGALVVQLTWLAGDAPRKFSLQLLGPDGGLLAQEDRDVPAGEGEAVLLIPRSSPPGEYRLALAVYDGATGERFPTAAGADLADLGAVRIDPAPAPAPVEYPPLRHPDDAEDEGS